MTFERWSIARSSAPSRKALAAGLARGSDRDVDRARDVPEALDVPLEAAVLGRRPRVEQRDLGRTQQTADVGGRQPHPVRTADREPAGGRRDVGIRQGPVLADPVREPAVEDPDLLEPVCAEAPPRARREQALRVVVDDHGRAIGDARPDGERRQLVRSREQDRPGVRAGLDEVGPPVDRDGAGDVSRREDASRAAIGTPPGIEDADLRPAEVFGQPLGGGQELGAGQATHRGYHRPVVVPFLPDAEKLTAIREAIPALSAGIYLNTGSVGPLPAETAAAMAEMANRERDVGRAHVDDVPEMYARMAEARAGVAAVLGTGRRGGRADPLDDRRHERRHAAPRLAAPAAVP